jgi:citrate lyase subunit beta/citryl-CoA lyase
MDRLYSYLFTPAGDAQQIEAAAKSATDAVMFDLEDAVPESSKDSARESLRSALESLDWGHKWKMIRVNEIASPHFERDVSLVGSGPDCFMLPKVQSAEELELADDLLTKAETAADVPVGRTQIYVMLESAKAVLKGVEILSASKRVSGVLLGPADFVADVGCGGIKGESWFFDPTIMDFAYANVVLAARAVGVNAIAGTVAATNNTEEQLRQMNHFFSLGYDGIIVISPSLIELIEQARQPGAVEYAFAKGVVETFEVALREKNSTVSF